MIPRSNNAEYLRNKRLLALEQGKCGMCRARPCAPNRRQCAECIAARGRLEQRKRRKVVV